MKFFMIVFSFFIAAACGEVTFRSAQTPLIDDLEDQNAGNGEYSNDANPNPNPNPNTSNGDYGNEGNPGQNQNADNGDYSNDGNPGQNQNAGNGEDGNEGKPDQNQIVDQPNASKPSEEQIIEIFEDKPNPNPNQYPNTNSSPNQYPNTNSNPSQYPNTNSSPNQYPNINSNPSQYPNTTSNPNQYPNTNSSPNQYPNTNSSPNQYPNTNSSPNQYPNTNSSPNQYPNTTSNPNQYPNTNSNPNQYPNTNSSPNQYPNTNSNPSQYPNSGPNIDIEITPESTSEVRLGVAFEDHKDNDYNDSVVCFVGKFVFDKNNGKIQSLADQSVDIFVKRNSGFSQNISFSIYRSRERALKPIFTVTDLVKGQERNFSNIKFQLGDYIQLNIEASVYYVSLPHTVNSHRVLIEKDRCRTEGN